MDTIIRIFFVVKLNDLFFSVLCYVIYVRLDATGKKSNSNKKWQAGIVISSALLVVGMLILGCLLYKRKKKLPNQGKLLTDGN